jgi:hypothetical protein
MSRLHSHVALIVASLFVAHETMAASIQGDWLGGYVCGQGTTALDLAIRETDQGELTAVFHFFAAAANPDVPEGCYVLRGRHDVARDTFDLVAQRWLLRPNGYVMVDMHGGRDPDGALVGVIPFAGCGTFRVIPTADPPARPAICGVGAPLLSLG